MALSGCARPRCVRLSLRYTYPLALLDAGSCPIRGPRRDLLVDPSPPLDLALTCCSPLLGYIGSGGKSDQAPLTLPDQTISLLGK